MGSARHDRVWHLTVARELVAPATGSRLTVSGGKALAITPSRGCADIPAETAAPAGDARALRRAMLNTLAQV